MSESLLYTKGASKDNLYKELMPQLESLVLDESNLIANMANTASVLKEAFSWLWIGFYIKDANNLVLGPFQGPLACTRIAFDKGVCGKAYSSKETIVVPDVDQFPNHIACSSLSKSEIVIPAIKNGKVEFVLDVDSEELNQFDLIDKKYLEQVVNLLLQSSN
jgi:L-methionine (R)-S-oxide reductase